MQREREGGREREKDWETNKREKIKVQSIQNCYLDTSTSFISRDGEKPTTTINVRHVMSVYM